MILRRSLFAVLAALAALSTIPASEKAGTVSIAMAPSILVDSSAVQQKFVAYQFPQLIREYTGLVGELKKSNSAKELADDLSAGTIQVGVFQGIEFAEAQERIPVLQPLLLVIYRSQEVKVIVAVKKDAPIKAMADLKGKDVAVLKEGKEHIRRFVEKETNADPEKFFSKVTNPANAEAALDAVLLGTVQAAIVDSVVMDIYREVNPGRFRNLLVVAESSNFPSPVIAYNPSATQSAVVQKFKDGMLSANRSAHGRDAMSSFRITSFEVVPVGFERSLASIRKEYSR